MFVFLVVCITAITFFVLYVFQEVMMYRKGRDVFDWIKVVSNYFTRKLK